MGKKVTIPNVDKITESFLDEYIIWLEGFIKVEVRRYMAVHKIFADEQWKVIKEVDKNAQELRWRNILSKELRKKWSSYVVKKGNKKKSTTGIAPVGKGITDGVTVCYARVSETSGN
jgi:hypothetical protein